MNKTASFFFGILVASFCFVAMAIISNVGIAKARAIDAPAAKQQIIFPAIKSPTGKYSCPANTVAVEPFEKVAIATGPGQHIRDVVQPICVSTGIAK